MAEQRRRRAERFAGKAAWQRVRTVGEKWKRAKAKREKAKVTTKTAQEAVEEAKKKASEATAMLENLR